MAEYRDEWGNWYGYCNACGEEVLMDTECCDDGEVVPYDDDDTPEGER